MRTNNIIERMDATMNTELITKKWNYDESVKEILNAIINTFEILQEKLKNQNKMSI